MAGVTKVVDVSDVWLPNLLCNLDRSRVSPTLGPDRVETDESRSMIVIRCTALVRCKRL